MSVDLSNSLVSSLISSVSPPLSDSEFTSALELSWVDLQNSAPQQSQPTPHSSIHSLLSLFLLECSRSSLSSSEISEFLSERNFPTSKLEILNRSIKENREIFKEKMVKKLVKSFPALVGASYRLDQMMKSSVNEEIRQPIFTLALDLENSREENLSEAEKFQFNATLPELQDLLAKVKEAVKQAQNERERES